MADRRWSFANLGLKNRSDRRRSVGSTDHIAVDRVSCIIMLRFAVPSPTCSSVHHSIGSQFSVMVLHNLRRVDDARRSDGYSSRLGFHWRVHSPSPCGQQEVSRRSSGRTTLARHSKRDSQRGSCHWEPLISQTRLSRCPSDRPDMVHNTEQLFLFLLTRPLLQQLIPISLKIRVQCQNSFNDRFRQPYLLQNVTRRQKQH